MKKKNIVRKISILLVLSIAVFAASCTQSDDLDKIGAYTTVIDKLYKEDSALNSNIEYIAVDTSSIVNLDDEEKSRIVNRTGEIWLHSAGYDNGRP